MNTKLIAVVAIATALGAAPAIAQQTAPGTLQTQPGQTGQQQQQQGQAGQQEMQQYVGWPVFSEDDQQIGTVASVEDEKLRVDLEQAMGMGSKTVEVEKDKFEAGENRINLSMSQEEARELPEAGN